MKRNHLYKCADCGTRYGLELYVYAESDTGFTNTIWLCDDCYDIRADNLKDDENIKCKPKNSS